RLGAPDGRLPRQVRAPLLDGGIHQECATRIPQDLECQVGRVRKRFRGGRRMMTIARWQAVGEALSALQLAGWLHRAWECTDHALLEQPLVDRSVLFLQVRSGIFRLSIWHDLGAFPRRGHRIAAWSSTSSKVILD